MRHDVLTHPKPEWIKRGIIAAGGQEPLTFTRRTGQAGSDPHGKHFSIYNEETVLRWKAQGVNLVIVSGQKGCGFKAEAENIEASKKMAGLCHKHGLYVGTYIGDTLHSETLFDEFPEAREWVQVDAFGRPVLYAASQAHRQKGCRNNPGYMGFLREATRMCVEDIGVDFLHYDNFFNRKQRCHCGHCLAKFRQFVGAKYTPGEMVERYGFQNADLIETPREIRGQEMWTWGAIRDPLVQDWIDFHCQAVADAYAELADYARTLKPDVVIECNPYGLGAANNFLRLSVDHPRLLPHGDVFWSEEHEYPQVTPDGTLYTKIRSYKLARTLDQVMFTYVVPYAGRGPALPSVCEALAFNGQTLRSQRPAHGRVRTLYDFRAEHEDLYLDTETLADAAILRHFHTLAFHSTLPRYEVQMAEQAAIQGHVPFDMIFDQQLPAASGYHVLILADVRCLSDAQMEQIRGLVRNGLGLVATGSTSMFDPWVRSRGELALKDVLGVSDPERAAWGPARRHTFGEGRVAYIPKLEPGGPFREFGPSERNLYLDIHRLPVNWREFTEAVVWAAGGLSAHVEAPPTVTCEFLRQTTTGRVLVHLVNYDPLQPVQDITLRFDAATAGPRRSARFLSPDPGAADAEVREADGTLQVTVPVLEAYGIVVVE